MDAFLQDIFRWLPSGWIYYLMIGLISFFESLALAGIFVPGSVLIVFAGFLAANGKGAYWLLFAAATAGAVAGDGLSYCLGARMGVPLMRHRLFRKRAQLLKKAELFFVDHGGKSVFIGRFVGFLRPFIPFIAGYARMRPLAFSFYVIFSGLLWGLAYPGLGYIFGASWKLVQVWTGRFSLLIGALVVVFILNALLWRWLVPPLIRLCSRLGTFLGRGWQATLATAPVRKFIDRHPRLWAALANRFRPGHGTGLYLTLGFVFSILFALSFVGLAVNLEMSAQIVAIDRRLHEIVPLLHHGLADALFLVLTYLGDGAVLVILGALACLWLLLYHRDFSAFIVAFGTLAGQALAFLLKHLIGRARPEPFFTSLGAESWAFPSAHAFGSAVFYGLVVYLLLDVASGRRTRLALVVGGSFLALLIGLSRIYLGVHWLSDVLGGFALAALWLSFLITACEMRRRAGGPFPWRKGLRLLQLPGRLRPWVLAGAVLIALGASGAYMTRQLPQDLRSQAPPAPPPVLEQVSPQRLGAALPTRTEDLSGDRLRPLSAIVFAARPDLVAALEQAGWRRTRQLSTGSFRELFVNLEHGRLQLNAPVVPVLVEAHDPAAAFARPVAGAALPARLTVQIWDLRRRLPDGRRAWGLLASRCLTLQSFLSIDLPVPVRDPEVDRQREILIEDLMRTGRIERHERLAGSPVEGHDSIGNRYISDGDTFLLWLPPGP